MLEALQEKLINVASNPGVYLMKDEAGDIIYVGKARNLKKRLASYFTAYEQLDPKTTVLVKKIAAFETIITRNEKEALILESNLIKRHRPKYNVILKDDKRYPCLRLDVKDPYPYLTVVRKIKNDGALYFGPFSSAQAVRETLKIINKTFKLRKCRARDFKNRTRPCLHCQMQRCLAPCCLDIEKTVYDEMVKDVVLFLKGRTPELIHKLKKEMHAAAQFQEYEKAAMLRDKVHALEKTLEKQIVVTADLKDRDVIALARSSDLSIITLLFVRSGYLLGTRHFQFDKTMSTDAELVGMFIRQYYEKTHFIPQEILVPMPFEDAFLLEEWLKTLKGTKVQIRWPQRGEKMRLMKMAVQNAENRLKETMVSRASDMELLNRLQKRLKLQRYPERIECFDNSNISGKNPVASMVVFVKGKPEKSLYRTYKITSVKDQNDYAYMYEVLKRRLGKGEKSKPYPDLLMVDGGKGQLNIARLVIKELRLEGEFELVGIAKKDEKKGEDADKIIKPERINPIDFSKDSNLLLFLQRIRDEAHRSAITFHRKRRSRSSLQSILDAIPGIGKKRKALLLMHFGSIPKIRAATIEELSALPGMNRKIAEAVHRALNRSNVGN